LHGPISVPKAHPAVSPGQRPLERRPADLPRHETGWPNGPIARAGSVPPHPAPSGPVHRANPGAWHGPVNSRPTRRP